MEIFPLTSTDSDYPLQKESRQCKKLGRAVLGKIIGVVRNILRALLQYVQLVLQQLALLLSALLEQVGEG